MRINFNKARTDCISKTPHSINLKTLFSGATWLYRIRFSSRHKVQVRRDEEDNDWNEDQRWWKIDNLTNKVEDQTCEITNFKEEVKDKKKRILDGFAQVLI